MIASPIVAAIELPPVVGSYLQWWVGGLIVVAGLLVYGLGDVKVFSLSRVWAISGVCFAESIRKRVLWITPLAILGIILISQFQRPTDEADALRQMLQVCLFTTGVVVTITAIILACTNLPKEIENRVIFTIVTKPTTRLEIVLGKVLGFARVALAILVIMGLFTVLFLAANAWGLQKHIANRLQSGEVDPTIRSTLEYYRDTGLLTARDLAKPDSVQIFAREPVEKDGLFFNAVEGDVMIPFEASADELVPPGQAGAGPLSAGLLVKLNVGFDDTLQKAIAAAAPHPAGVPDTVASPDAQIPSAKISIALVDENENSLVPSAVIEKGQDTTLPDPAGAKPLLLFVDPRMAPDVSRWQRFYVVVSGVTSNVLYSMKPDSIRVIIPSTEPNGQGREIKPSTTIENWRFRGRFGRVGYQVRGGDANKEPTHVATFRFTGVNATPESSTRLVPLEFRSDIERSGADDKDATPTQMALTIVNRSTGKSTPLPPVALESNRPVYVKVPADAVTGGNFDVNARCLTSGHYLGVTRASMSVVQANQGFVLNLGKSLLIMWLMATLVVTVAIFCSTFVSWPIAIVLTLLLLLGRWTVEQLGDALQPGIGNQVANDLFGTGNPEVATTVSKLVEALARFLNVSARVLPDISQFAAIEDLKQGLAIPWNKLGDAARVLLTFGIPVSVLSYVFLRNKEVAP